MLVVQAATRAMNPLVPQVVLDRAYADDEAVASAEYGAQFRRDVESFVAREVVEACVVPGRYELPPVSGVEYRGFVDPSGGSQDAMTLAIAHAESGHFVLDVVREVRPPFSPETVAADFAATLKRYGLAHVTGDRYGGEWPREQFRKHGVDYELAAHTKLDLYRELLPLLNSATVAWLDLPRLVAQVCGLERRTARGGKDSIDHSPHGHDDVINAAAGAVVLAAKRAALPPLILRCAGRTISSALTPSLLDRIGETVSAQNLAEGCRSKAEQARLDAHEAQQRRKQTTAFEEQVKHMPFGVWFPQDQFGSGWNQTTAGIRDYFARWH